MAFGKLPRAPNSSCQLPPFDEHTRKLHTFGQSRRRKLRRLKICCDLVDNLGNRWSLGVSSAQMTHALLFAGGTAATLNLRASLSRVAQMLRRSLSSRVRK